MKEGNKEERREEIADFLLRIKPFFSSIWFPWLRCHTEFFFEIEGKETAYALSYTVVVPSPFHINSYTSL